jgi:predicted nucleic acid-binding protein
VGAEATIADSSALIALQQVDQLSLLKHLFGSILIPPAVAREIAASLSNPPAWIDVRVPKRPRNDRVLAASLGDGETEVLSLALETPAPCLILDDLPARHLADELGLKKLGTCAVLLEAKRSGLIAEVRPMLDALLATGFRLSPRIYETILMRANEARG